MQSWLEGFTADRANVAAKVPKTLLAHYEQLMAGNECVRGGTVIKTGGQEAFAKRDLETMERLLKMPQAWVEMERTVGADWLPPVFDALWTANLDWDHLRNDGKKRRRALIDDKIEQIVGAIGKLEKLLDELHDIAAHVGGGPHHPDRWPDSLFLRDELIFAREKCDGFKKEHVSAYPWVNAALGVREDSPRVYLQALVTRLDEIGFPFGDKRTPHESLIDLANAAANADGDIDYDAFYAVLQPARKKRHE